MAGYTLHLSNEQPDILRSSWWLQAHYLLDCSYISNFIEHRREIIGIVHIADTTHDRPILQNFLDPSMEIPNNWRAVHHGFSFKRKNQAQDTMSTWMLRSHIEQHFLGLETFRSFYILSD